ncbi:MAG: PAS domain S-box protein [Magnetovibrio sp.]|nr:PAS domain S-box protein [Magnetovibrio sp.]
MTKASRPLPFILLAATALLVVVFYFQTRHMDLDRQNSTAHDILSLKQLDTQLSEETLKAASLQISNYDTIVRTISEIQVISERLHNPDTGLYGLIGPEIDKRLNTLQSLMLTKFELVESIKSRMAIVRNTVNYLPLEVTRITQHRTDFGSMVLQRLITALLVNNLTPTPTNKDALERIFEIVQAIPFTEDNQGKVDMVLVHVRANLSSREATMADMAKFTDQNTIQILDEIMDMHIEYSLNRIKLANQFRILLLVLSLALFAGLAFALFQLRKAHDQARMTSRQFRDAVESINEGFAFFDANGRLSFWNQKFGQLHQGLGNTLNKGMTYESFFNACTDNNIYQEFMNANGSKQDQIEHGLGRPYIVKSADGTWIMSSDSRMADGGTACVRVDMTDAKRTEEKLRNLSRAVEQSPASVMITNTKGIITYVNPKFEEATGYSYDEAVGQGANLVNSGEKSAKEYSSLWETLSQGKEWHGEFHNKRKDGTLFWEYASISPVKNDLGETTHYLAVKEDITDRKQALADLILAKEQAEMASHAKTQFLANMSHELRTPLNAIIGFSEIIKEQMFGSIDNDNYVEYSINIHASGQHLLEVINDILDVSRIESGTMTIREDVVDIAHLCDETIEMIQPQAHMAKLKLVREIDENLPLIRGDMLRIKQIIINLLTNAIKFTPQDGKVTLVGTKKPDGSIMLAVRDTGYGIPKDKQDKILEPFEQVSDIYSRNHEGSGLGLFLVSSFVALHQAELIIDSDIDQGTTVTVNFPASRLVVDAQGHI